MADASDIMNMSETRFCVTKKRKGSIPVLSWRFVLAAGRRQCGNPGPGVVPHKLEESVIGSAISWEDFEMPPKQKLPAHVIADFKKAQFWFLVGEEIRRWRR